jgi:hypothetical protein
MTFALCIDQLSIYGDFAVIRALGRDPVLVLSASADLERVDIARGVGRARCVPVGVRLSSAYGLTW